MTALLFIPFKLELKKQKCGHFLMNLLSWSISRVLSWTIIYLGDLSPNSLKRSTQTQCEPHYSVLFDLAPNGVWPAINCYQWCGVLLPHLFTLANSMRNRRFYFLFHFPSRFRARPLAGILLCGARTFLPVCLTRYAATVCPTCMSRGL